MWKYQCTHKTRPVLGMIEYGNWSKGTPVLLPLHPSITKIFNLWIENYCLFRLHSVTVPDSQAEGMANTISPPTPLSSEYSGYYLLHLQSRAAEMAIKVSHCPEIIIRWCLGLGLEIMSALLGPQGRRKGSGGMWDRYSCFVLQIIGGGITFFF